MMGNGNAVLEVFLMGGATPRLCKPGAYEYWHIAFDVDDVEEILKILKDYKCQRIRTTASGRSSYL